jgi:hypothetical protein
MPHRLVRSMLWMAAATLAPALLAQDAGKARPIPPKEVRVTHVAKGSFDVALTPLKEGSLPGGWAPGRMALDKRFQGALEATSQGVMMTAMSDTKGSGAYTAFERVQGTLDGRRGAFVLMHHAVMTQGVPGEWGVRVVPDSGTDGLKGLEGRMTITITGKDHAYALEYTLPEPHEGP